jgi:hypothetical protein
MKSLAEAPQLGKNIQEQRTKAREGHIFHCKKDETEEHNGSWVHRGTTSSTSQTTTKRKH